MPAFDVLEPSIMVKVGPWGLEKLGTQMRLLTGLVQWGGLSFVLGSLSRGKAFLGVCEQLFRDVCLQTCSLVDN